METAFGSIRQMASQTAQPRPPRPGVRRVAKGKEEWGRREARERDEEGGIERRRKGGMVEKNPMEEWLPRYRSLCFTATLL